MHENHEQCHVTGEILFENILFFFVKIKSNLYLWNSKVIQASTKSVCNRKTPRIIRWLFCFFKIVLMLKTKTCRGVPYTQEHQNILDWKPQNCSWVGFEVISIPKHNFSTLEHEILNDKAVLSALKLFSPLKHQPQDRNLELVLKLAKLYDTPRNQV